MDEVYPESVRHVFAYHDGTAVVFADPLALDRRYDAALAGEDRDSLNAALRGADPRARDHAATVYAAAVRAAFELEPFDRTTGRGTTDAMVTTLWERYCDWADALKLATGSTAKSSPSSADPAAPAPPLSPPPIPEPPPAPPAPSPSGTAPPSSST